MKIRINYLYLLSCILRVDGFLLEQSSYVRAKEGICSSYVLIAPGNAKSKLMCGNSCSNMKQFCVGYCFKKSTMECKLYTIPNILALLPPYGYKLYETIATYDAASTTCRSSGSYLSLPENLKQQQLLDSFTTVNQWIGANDRAQEGNWTRSYDGKQINFTYWTSGEPGGGTVENCAVFITTWVDVSCIGSFAFVCQSPAPGCPNAPKGNTGENVGETCYLKL